MEEMLKQGAEARVYKTTYQDRPAILKTRFCKTYRHPDLDRQLTKKRLKGEVKGIERCKNLGIRTPTVYFVDNKTNGIYMELIENVDTVNICITNLLKGEQADTNNEHSECQGKLKTLALEIGSAIGKMHAADIIHGDLTTSNLLVDRKLSEASAEIVLIDFGLSSKDPSAEDKGVDLYVLEKALVSTHSGIPSFFEFVLESYMVANTKDSAAVFKKLEEIRLRGRKRTMIG